MGTGAADTLLCSGHATPADSDRMSNVRTLAKGTFMTAKANAFDVGDYVVYPKHGVGRVIELLEQEIAGMHLELYVLRFEKERMTLRVPVGKVEAIGMRKLSSDKTLREALTTLEGKPKVKRTMWSRRAQE
jgi:CarD family transcriptional regulator